MYQNKLGKIFDKIEHGQVTVHVPSGWHKTFGNKADYQTKPAELYIKSWNAIDRVISRGSTGSAEAYMFGDWDTDDLPAFLEVLANNADGFNNLLRLNPIVRGLFNIKHSIFNKNTRGQAAKNISKHYDLGNDFYSLWLDDSMTYSSGIYNTPQEKLEKAQANKYNRILDKFDSSGRVLEIGCGWGGFAEKAAQANHDIDCLTISNEQKDFAEKRLKKAGLNNANIKFQDYRDSEGEYDYIASIEMFEAVGMKYWDSYFNTVSNRLKSSGKAVIQTITIKNETFDFYVKNPGFIQLYIFPGGMLPSDERFKNNAKNVGLEVANSFEFGKCYAKTLMEWLKRFDAKREEIKAMGFADEFIRMWRYYLSYCYAGFMSGVTNVAQYELVKN